MFLEGKVQTAKMSMFYDLEVAVVDRQVVKPMGGRPQYNCRIVRGWPGVDDLAAMKKLQRKKPGEVSDQDLENYASQITLPQEDDVIPLIVVDIAGKSGFQTLICEVAATGP